VNRTVENDPHPGVRSLSLEHSDDYFIELCALSTTDVLTIEEWRQLELHLSVCPSCREIKAQYDAVIATTLPALARDHKGADDDFPSDSWSETQAETSLMARIDRENMVPDKNLDPSTGTFRWRNLPWLYAGAAIFLVASLFTGYRIGIRQGRNSMRDVALSARRTGNLPPQLDRAGAAPSPTHGGNDLEAAKTAELRHQLQDNLLAIASLKQQKSSLEKELAERNADLDQASSERADFHRDLSLAQSNAQDLENKLNLTADQKSQETQRSATLQAQVDELTASLREKDQQIAQHEELLGHDRDIRNLIGARDLYIAEIYDVAKTGKTQKPFGRVFYTRGKSLVFYAYDLDQQPGVKFASTFQAWGRRGIDQRHDINLGIFYQDDQNKKRWILKSKDATTLGQIDAVFVTVEPNGESAKPSGKPLLFTYLRLMPNHP
jgi:hypothetical protein